MYKNPSLVSKILKLLIDEGLDDEQITLFLAGAFSEGETYIESLRILRKNPKVISNFTPTHTSLNSDGSFGLGGYIEKKN